MTIPKKIFISMYVFFHLKVKWRGFISYFHTLSRVLLGRSFYDT